MSVFWHAMTDRCRNFSVWRFTLLCQQIFPFVQSFDIFTFFAFGSAKFLMCFSFTASHTFKCFLPLVSKGKGTVFPPLSASIFVCSYTFCANKTSHEPLDGFELNVSSKYLSDI